MPRRRTGSACTCTRRRTSPTSADAEAQHGARVAARLERSGALDDRTLLAHGVHLDDPEIELVRAAGASIAHNARSNMNNAHRPGAGRRRSARASRSGRTGSAPTCSRSPGRRSSASTRTASAAGPEWALTRLAEGARFVGRAFDAAEARNARDGRARRPRRPRLRGPGAAPRDELRRTLDLRALLPLGPRRHGGGRVGRPRPAARARRPAGARRRARAGRPTGSGSGSRRSAPTRSSRKEVGDGRRHW